MDSAIQYYIDFVISLCLILPFVTICVINKSIGRPSITSSKIQVIILAILSISFLGFRAMDSGDTLKYISNFLEAKFYIRNGSKFEILSRDVGFDFWVRICAYFITSRQFLFVTASLFVIPLLFAYKNFFGNKMLLPFYLFVCTFFFWALGSSIIRSGLSVSFFLLAISIKEKSPRQILCFAISLFMHLSIALAILCFISAKYLKRDRIIWGVWIVCLLIAYLRINIIPDLSAYFHINSLDQRLDVYTEMSGLGLSYKTGFRLDFILFGVAFIVYGYFFIKKYNYDNHFYKRIIRAYTLANSFFLLTLQMPYSDRFAICSWLFIPLITAFPLLEIKTIKYNSFKLLGIIIVVLLLSIFIITY